MKLHTIYRGTMTKMNIDCSSETMEDRKIWNNAFRIETKQNKMLVPNSISSKNILKAK